MTSADDNLDATPNVSAERIPVFSRKGDEVNFYYISQVVQRAMDFGDVRYNAVEHEALEQIQTAANTPGVPLEFMLEPGYLEVINARSVMHSRQEYEDYPAFDRRRHLLQLWMAVTPETNSKTFLAPGDRK